MVKFKSRYLLVEINYENDKQIQSLDAYSITNTIKDEITKYFGLEGLGKVNKNIQTKYLNSFTNLMIIRVGREQLKMIWTVVSLLNEINGTRMRMRVLSVSGSIKKCEVKATEMLKTWMINYKREQN